MKLKLILIFGIVSFAIFALMNISCNKNERSISDRPLANEPSMGGKSAKDQKEACTVASFIQKGCVTADVDQKILKIYCKGGALSSHIHIYGITKHSNQDIIVKMVESEFRKQGWKRIYLLFLEKENFI